MDGGRRVGLIRGSGQRGVYRRDEMTPSGSEVRKGDVRRAVIVRTRKEVRRPDGTYVRFDDNAAVLLNNKREMLGTRIGGIVNADLRLKGWSKIVSLAPRVSFQHCPYILHYLISSRWFRATLDFCPRPL